MERFLKGNQADLSQPVTRCPSCHSTDFFKDNGDMICERCNTNIGADIDFKPEWRNDITGDDMSRCNLPRNDMLPESSMSTCMALRPGASQAQYELRRALIWDSVNHRERNMKTRIDDIAYICKDTDIPEVIMERAQKLYFDFIGEVKKQQLKNKRGDNDIGLKGAAIYLALVEVGRPRTYKEIAKLVGVDASYVSDGIDMFELITKIESHTANYSDYIEVFCENLDLSDEIKERVLTVANKANDLGILENNSLTSMIAGCISYVAEEMALPLRPTDIAACCEVSAPTINKVCAKLCRRAMDLLEDD